MTTAPDVTVITAVYNTMPYLTRCLTSLAEQSIGLDRLEVIMVDDGSTDGSGKELDRYAKLYPGTFKVIHQANSGGPAAPSNRALEHATGRYVFFVGSDDHLGREALERMVSAADTYGSDVVLGRLVGFNGRYVHQAIFDDNNADVSLFDSALPWSLSNTKLFRRELIEKHRLRYPEDMPVLSDQPFTIEASFYARRISVLSDYDFYHAVRRVNAANITYRSKHEVRARCTEKIMDLVARLVEAGPKRDAINIRHFTWELSKLVEADFLQLEREVQERVCAVVGRLTEQHFTDAVRAQTDAAMGIRFQLAQRGSVDALTAVIREDAEHGSPPILLEGGQVYAAYSCFRDPSLALPDGLFDVTAHAAEFIAKKITVTSVSWEQSGRVLHIIANSPSADLSAYLPLQMSVGDVTSDATLEPAKDGTTVRARLAVGSLLAGFGPDGGHLPVRVGLSAFGTRCDTPLRAPRMRRLPQQFFWRGPRPYRISPAVSHTGHLLVTTAPVTMERLIRRLRRSWPKGRK
jgi:glycosyltransferase involved in cell wall biosynthesis